MERRSRMSQTKCNQNGDNTILNLHNLSVKYGNKSALKNICLTVRKGEKIAIVGESGSGKSTLVNALLNILPPNASVNQDAIQSRQNLKISYIPQDPNTNLNPVLKIGDQIKDVLKVVNRQNANKDTDVNKDVIYQQIQKLLQNAGLDATKSQIQSYPHEFSGGMKQRVLVALSISPNPDLILADEPTSALDVTIGQKVLDTLNELVNKSQTALMFITHDIGLARQYANRIIVLKDGSIVEAGESHDIIRSPKMPYTKLLIDNNSQKYKKRTDLAVNKNKSSHILEVVNLTKSFNKKGSKKYVEAVKDVSLTIDEGEIMSIVGESGSGKTTLVNLMLGALKSDKGDIYFRNNNLQTILKNKKMRKDFNLNVSAVYQNPYSSLNQRMMIKDIIMEPMLIHKNAKPEYRDKSVRNKRVLELLELVELDESFYNRYPVSLSGGQRQRVAIARALAIKPKVVFFDEAISALDVIVGNNIVKLLKSLQKNLNLTVIFVTHDLMVANMISDKILVMKDGLIVENASTTEILQNPQNPYTKQLFDAAYGRNNG